MFMLRSIGPRLAATLRAALAPPGAVMLPLFVLPVVLGAFWLWLTHEGAVVAGRPAVALGTMALVWYLLGGALTVRRLRDAAAARRTLRLRRQELEAMPGVVWATDSDHHILWQSVRARLTYGDRLGARIDTVLARLSADPGTLADSLHRRAGFGTEVAVALTEGHLVLRPLAGGALQIWSHRLPQADATPPATVPAPVPRACIDHDLFQRLPAGLMRIDSDGHIAEANAMAETLLGPIAEGATLSSLLDGLGRPVDHWVDDVLRARTEARPEVLHCRNAAAERHVQVVLSPDGRGGLLAMLSDASAMKTLEAQFVQSQKMQAIGQLAGGIAHDFNNLLTAISGHCDLLMLRHDAADPDYSDLDQISQNANRAASLVGQLLAFSRKQTLKPQLIDLRDTLSDLTHLLNRLVGERVALTLEHDPDLRPIRADRRQFEQVIVNLVVNARDAMAHGGRITIRTADVGRAEERARPQLPKGDYVRVVVEDEGCGIPADKLDKIFEPFFTTKRTGEGTGLGLSTVYGIVKQTGGYVFCDSVPGEGTSFSLYFPAHDADDLNAAAEVEEAVRPSPPPQRLARAGVVLLVEDEAAVRSFAARALRMRGFEVLEADSAEAALDLLADSRQSIDVFVTDVIMPGMDGPSWVRTALRDRPGTRVVFISGYSEDIFDDGRTPVPNSIFVQKPFTLAGLSDAVQAQFVAVPQADTGSEADAASSRMLMEVGQSRSAS